MDATLLDTTCDFDGDLCRNIVSLRTAKDVFADLAGNDSELSRTAQAAEMRVKVHIPPSVIARGFHYTTAIEYPFATEPYLRSRYGDGTFGVWYGALETETTYAETAYHMIIDESRLEGVNEVVVRERALYHVHCRALLTDLSAKRASHPELVRDDYTDTLALARRLVSEGHPGLLAPSARCDGTSAAIFNRTVLNNPRLQYFLTYRYTPHQQAVLVERLPGQPLLRYQLREGVVHVDRF